MGHSVSIQPKKNENLHLTFFNFAQIWFLGLFWLKKLKFQI